jgi:protein-S-isoprenylcysteine O-methyltransferase Ste14
MDPLRIILFSGLIVHKLVWELLKKRARALQSVPSHSTVRGRAFIKMIKLLVLLFLLYQTLFLNVLPIADDPFVLRVWGASIYSLGLATAILGRVQLGRNWVDLEDYQVLPEQSLTTAGIYRYIRHPIYSGDMLLLVGLELALNSWLVLATVILLAVVVRQALAEEALLARVYPNYGSYCRATKRFIPFVA